MGVMAAPGNNSQEGRKNPNMSRGGPRNGHTSKGGKGGKGFNNRGKGGKVGRCERNWWGMACFQGGKGGAPSSINTSPTHHRGMDTPTKGTPEKKEDVKIDLSGPSLAVSAAILAAGKKLDKEAVGAAQDAVEGFYAFSIS